MGTRDDFYAGGQDCSDFDEARAEVFGLAHALSSCPSRHVAALDCLAHELSTEAELPGHEIPGPWTETDRQKWFRILLDASYGRMTKRERRAFGRKYPMIAEAVEGIVGVNSH